MVYKSGQIFLPFCHNARVWRTDRQTDRQTEFSSLDRVCIACSAVKSREMCIIVSWTENIDYQVAPAASFSIYVYHDYLSLFIIISQLSVNAVHCSSVTECCYANTVLFTVWLHIVQRTVLQKPFCPSVRPSFCLSVYLSVKRVHCENERNLCQTYTIWKNVYPSFPTRRLVGGGQPLYPKFWGQTGPVRAKIADFRSIFARSASAVTSSLKFN